MAVFTRTHQRTVGVGDATIQGAAISIEFGARADINEDFAATTANQLVAYTLDVSQARSVTLYGTGAFTIKPNSSSSPPLTINLPANRVIEWTHLDGVANPLGTTDITALYITPATAGTNLKIYVGLDPTV